MHSWLGPDCGPDAQLPKRPRRPQSTAPAPPHSRRKQPLPFVAPPPSHPSPNKSAVSERAAVGAYLNLTATQAAAALPAASAKVRGRGAPAARARCPGLARCRWEEGGHRLHKAAFGF